MAEQNNTPLTNVSGWQKAYTDKLEESWITDAEQVVGIAATPEGIQALAQQLAVSIDEMQRLIASACAALPPSVVKELEKEVDTSRYGLGPLFHPLRNQSPSVVSNGNGQGLTINLIRKINHGN